MPFPNRFEKPEKPPIFGIPFELFLCESLSISMKLKSLPPLPPKLLKKDEKISFASLGLKPPDEKLNPGVEVNVNVPPGKPWAPLAPPPGVPFKPSSPNWSYTALLFLSDNTYCYLI